MAGADLWRPWALGLAVRLARLGLVSDLRWYDAFAGTPRHLLVPETSTPAGTATARMAQVYSDGDAFPDPRELAFTLGLLDPPADTAYARPREVVQLGHPDLYLTALLCARWGIEHVTVAEPDPRRTDLLVPLLERTVGRAPRVVNGQIPGSQHGRYDAALLVDRSPYRAEIAMLRTSLKRLLRPDGRLVRGPCTGTGHGSAAVGLVDVFERDARHPLLSSRHLRPPPRRAVPDLTVAQLHLMSLCVASPGETAVTRAQHVADDRGGCRVCGPPHPQPGPGHGELLLCPYRVLADLAWLRALAPPGPGGPGGAEPEGRPPP